MSAIDLFVYVILGIAAVGVIYLTIKANRIVDRENRNDSDKK